MSVDIYLQAFEEGDIAGRDGGEVRHLLLAHADGQEPERNFVHIVCGDDGADVYGVPQPGEALDSLLFNHVEGQAFDLLVDVARTADLVVLPVGCPVCVVSEAQIAHLPEGLTSERVVRITRGAELRALIEES